MFQNLHLCNLSFVHYSNHEELVRSLQDKLVDIQPQGAHESIINHLTHPQDKVACQAMAFLAALVYNGNEKAQQKIGRSVKSKDTEMFTRMDAIIESASECIKADPRRQATYIVRLNEILLQIYIVMF